MSAVCPRCGAAASGNFCSTCGASLAALTCPSCGHTPAPGARFCNTCGAALANGPAPSGPAAGAPAGAAPRGESQLAWWIAGTTLVALIVLMAWPVIHPKQEAPQPATAAAGGPVAPFAGGAAGGGSPPDLSKMTPKEAADRLYNRVMQAVEGGDEAQVQQFMPMALQAYGMVQPLDEDSRYHLATLQRAKNDFAGAIATADEGLAKKPDHLLLLAAAGEAAESLKDTAKAKGYWKHFLDVWDVQHALGLEEYRDHENVLQESRAHAREVVGA